MPRLETRALQPRTGSDSVEEGGDKGFDVTGILRPSVVAPVSDTLTTIGGLDIVMVVVACVMMGGRIRVVEVVTVVEVGWEVTGGGRGVIEISTIVGDGEGGGVRT